MMCEESLRRLMYTHTRGRLRFSPENLGPCSSDVAVVAVNMYILLCVNLCQKLETMTVARGASACQQCSIENPPRPLLLL